MGKRGDHKKYDQGKHYKKPDLVPFPFVGDQQELAHDLTALATRANMSNLITAPLDYDADRDAKDTFLREYARTHKKIVLPAKAEEVLKKEKKGYKQKIDYEVMSAEAKNERGLNPNADLLEVDPVGLQEFIDSAAAKTLRAALSNHYASESRKTAGHSYQSLDPDSAVTYPLTMSYRSEINTISKECDAARGLTPPNAAGTPDTPDTPPGGAPSTKTKKIKVTPEERAKQQEEAFRETLRGGTGI